jgi:hypothetical protein
MTAEILAATEHLVLRRMTNDDAAALAAYRSDPAQARGQSWETPDPFESTLMPHTPPSRRRQLWAPCGHGALPPRSTIKHQAAVLHSYRWGGWGSNPRPRDYESHALTG